MQECKICFTEKPGSQFYRIEGCGHFYCRPCFHDYCAVMIKEGAVNKLRCPSTKCPEMLPPHIIRDSVSPEAFAKWERLLLDKTLDSMEDIVYCPRCKAVVIEESDNSGRCPSCFFVFCTLCMESWHLGTKCMTPQEKVKIIELRKGGNRTLSEDERRKIQDMKNELLSVSAIEKDAVKCPHCNMAIEKTEGCNKMVCLNCGGYFCYRCRKAISGYEHFGSESCVLFDQAEVDRWNLHMNAPPPNPLLVRMEGVPPNQRRMRFCPRCRQGNMKFENNNHLCCWSCRAHYCYLCGKEVRDMQTHFTGMCKQHSPD